MVSAHHPAVRRPWSVQEWLAGEHIAPTRAYPGWRGVIDEHLDRLGLARRITARVTAGEVSEVEVRLP